MNLIKNKTCPFSLTAVIILTISIFIFLPQKIKAQSRLESDNYTITWPNLNTGATSSANSSNYNLGVTTGQIAPGLYSSTGYKIRAGFQYIHSIIPFYFKISTLALNFGSLTLDSLVNEQEITLTVNSGAAGGYQVKVQENDPLTSTTGSYIQDTTCDIADTCDESDSGTWTQTSTYGFGYTMAGDDVSTDFDSNKFKNFPDEPGESPAKIMGLTPLEGHQAERGKIATMTARINIDSLQPAGTYRNVLKFFALPTY